MGFTTPDGDWSEIFSYIWIIGGKTDTQWISGDTSSDSLLRRKKVFSIIKTELFDFTLFLGPRKLQVVFRAFDKHFGAFS